MRKWIVAGGAVIVLGILVLGMMMSAMTMLVGASAQNQQALSHSMCSASWQGDGDVEGLSRDQLDAAATIYAAAQSAGVGDHGAIIGIATAMQESRLGAEPRSKTPNGDGDIGLFQQRSLVGWYGLGKTQEENIQQLSDYAYQAKNFFQGVDTIASYHIPGLININGWQQMTLTQAAQAVQRSAFPDAYAPHEAIARLLVQQLSGGGASPILCSEGMIGGSLDCAPSGLSTEAGLKPDALRGLRCIKQNWPQIQVIGGKRHDTDSDHHVGNAIDPMIPNFLTSEGIKLGDEIASWAQANAAGLGVKYVIWRERIWSPSRASEGWRYCGGPQASCYTGPDHSASHRDHVHISFLGDQGTGVAVDADTGGSSSGIVAPMKKGTYKLGAYHGQKGRLWSSGYHTGQDFVAGEGTPLLAVSDGVITKSVRHRLYGNLVVLTAKDGTQFYYAHLSVVSVRQGQTVTAGRQIGGVGTTGNSTGNHLHFEVRVGGRHTDPKTWLAQRGVTV